ncbi:MAG TPA: thioredoxin domain-containing protein [Bryobacteraceae bacterium]
MTDFVRRAAMLAAALCTFGGLLLAQEWQTANALPGVDLQGLTTAQKTTVLKILRTQGCTCGCSMKLAQCRIEDPSCSFSTGMAGIIVDTIKAGKSEAEAVAAASASRWAHQETTGRVLDDAVPIPTAGAPVIGEGSAPVTIVEFSDFQCPYCIAAVPQINALLKAFPRQVKLIFKQYPLESHSDAHLAAAAALAAHNQGKFWAMHNSLFAHHDDLSRPILIALAKENGLDTARFERDLDSKEVEETIAKDIRDGDRANVEGTPTIFINGQRYNGPIQLNFLKPLIDAELKKAAPAVQTASGRR